MKKLLLLCLTLLAGLTVSAKLTATYWTADGQLHKLPEESQTLFVPAEAVAVDLRGHATVNVATINVSSANPNCLYYFDANASLPKGLQETYHNVILGMESTMIQINEDYDFYCPITFNSQFVSFLMRPTNDSGHVQGYSETLVLPFNPERALFYELNEVVDMCYSNLLKVFRYERCEHDSLVFSKVNKIDEMEAYQPYILGARIQSSLLFMAENAVVPMTREAIIYNHGGYDMTGTTVARTFPGFSYMYAAEANGFSFVFDGRLAPFRACFVPSDINYATFSAFLPFKDDMWETDSGSEATSIESRQLQLASDNLPVYSLNGQHMIDIDILRSRQQTLRRGLYIVGGKKILVR